MSDFAQLTVLTPTSIEGVSLGLHVAPTEDPLVNVYRGRYSFETLDQDGKTMPNQTSGDFVAHAMANAPANVKAATKLLLDYVLEKAQSTLPPAP